MTLAEFVQNLVTLGASPSVIAVTVEYVTQRDASRDASHDGGVTLIEQRQKSAARSRKYRANIKRDGGVTERDVERDGAGVLSSSSLLPCCSEGSSNREESKRLVVPREADDWPADYETVFWKAYPRKVGRKQARAKLRVIRQRGEVTFAVLMAGVAKIPTAEPQFIPHPTTWINRGGWDDEEIPGGANGHRGPRAFQDDRLSLSKAADKLIEQAERGEFSFGPRPSLSAQSGENDIRVLPKG